MLVLPAFGASQTFTEWPIANGTFDGVTEVSGADLDQDGDLDVVAASRGDNVIAWWENDVSVTPVWTYHGVGPCGGANGVYAGDLDGDGAPDILASCDNGDDIVWWESDGGSPPSFAYHLVDSWYVSPTSVYAEDLDGDGDVDVLATATQQGITWWENDGTASPEFAAHKHIINYEYAGAMSVYAADVDGDGDNDVLGASGWDGYITWWKNRGGSPPSFQENLIESGNERVNCVHADDLDGDGDMDVLASVGGTIDDIVWWENDGSQHFTRHTIKDLFDNANSVYTADVDGDGDVDVLGSAGVDDEITWWENDPSGDAPPSDPIVWTEHKVKGNFQGATDVYCADFDNDEDMDILGAAYEDEDITWWENMQDFSISCSNPNQAVPAGSAAVFDIAVTSEGGFSRPVTLTVDGLPQGTAATFTTSPVTPTASSILTIATDVSTPSGTHELTLTGSSRDRSRSITLSLDVQDFEILNETPPRIILPGGWVTFTVALGAVNGFHEEVHLSTEGLPPGYLADFAGNPVIPSGTSVMTVTAGTHALRYPQELAVVGTSGSLAHSTTVRLEPPNSVRLVLIMKDCVP